MADVPHLLKSIRNCLLTQSIILPDFVVADANLQSNVVSLQPVKDLIAMQDNMTLKIAHKLKKIHVEPGNFQKMKVSIAAQLLSHSTASALKLCVGRGLLPQSALTTAWFVEAVNNWFDILNARFSLASLFKSSSAKIEHLDYMIALFHDLHFSGRDGWKPIQTGVRLSTESVVSLYDDLVVKGSYKYLMTGRLTQDCVENLFSQIRSKGDSHPSPVHFRHSLRLISIAQYMHVSQNSSYDTDESVYFLDFLKSKSFTKPVSNNDDDVEMEKVCSQLLPLSECESNALYAVAGWTVFKEKTPKACPVCLSSIVGDASTAPEHSQLTVIKVLWNRRWPYTSFPGHVASNYCCRIDFSQLRRPNDKNWKRFQISLEFIWTSGPVEWLSIMSQHCSKCCDSILSFAASCSCSAYNKQACCFTVCYSACE